MCILVHVKFIRSFVCNMKRPSLKQIIKQQVCSKLPPIWNYQWWMINQQTYCWIYVFSESPFEMVTAQVSSLLLKFTPTPHLKLSWMADQVLADLLVSVRTHLKLLKLPASPSHLLPELPSSLVPIKFTTSVTFKFTDPLLKLSLMTDQVLADICVQWEPIWNYSSLLLMFTAQVSSLLLKFTPYPHVKLSWMADQVLADLLFSVRTQLKLLKCTAQVYQHCLQVYCHSHLQV